jgi:hypothetical protein
MPDHHPDLHARAVYACWQCASGEVLNKKHPKKGAPFFVMNSGWPGHPGTMGS